MTITKFAIPEIIFGHGCLKHTGQCALRLGAKKVFLVSDHGIEKAGWVDQLKEILIESGLSWSYYSNVSENPKDYEVEEGAQQYRKDEADVIIALGGGSTIDTAKGIAILANNGGRINDYEGANQIDRALPPMILITTTAGSGSDISQFCIITDTTRKVKMSIISRTLMPNISIIDPKLLTTKSSTLIIHSAVDAFCHAVEAYVSKLSSPFTELQSLQAIRLIYKYLPKAIAKRDSKSLEKLSIASVSASMAFSNASLGAEHALAHALGGHLDVPHGAIHPILLPAVMRYNLPSCADKFAKISTMLFNHKAATSYDTGLGGIVKIENFFKTLPVATTLCEIIREEDKGILKTISKIAMDDACILTNPRDARWQDLHGICLGVWS